MKYVYYYHTNHLGSSSVVTQHGEVIQKLDYLPFGELWYDKRYGDWETMYTFSGKERDAETGLSYFGARYYDSDMGIWLSVDPLLDKYPSFSPYVYCANNPVRYFDPDGRKIVPMNDESKRFIDNYLNSQFGSNNTFKYNGKGELKINRIQYKSLYRTATNSQRYILEGMKQAIKRRETLRVYINSNSNIFNVLETHYSENPDGSLFYDPIQFNVNLNGAGITLGPNLFLMNSDYYIFMNDYQAQQEEVTGSKLTGKDDIYKYGTGKDASSVFIHEVLDEFLNYFIKGNIRNESSQRKKVIYQNNALKNVNKMPRDGNDHQ